MAQSCPPASRQRLTFDLICSVNENVARKEEVLVLVWWQGGVTRRRVCCAPALAHWTEQPDETSWSWWEQIELTQTYTYTPSGLNALREYTFDLFVSTSSPHTLFVPSKNLNWLTATTKYFLGPVFPLNSSHLSKVSNLNVLAEWYLSYAPVFLFQDRTFISLQFS